MPKVETHSFKHNTLNTTFTADVFFGKMRDQDNYTLRNKKVFYIKLSDEAASYHGYNHVYADTFKEVTDKWEAAIIEFMDSVRYSRKVIAIDVASIMFEELAVKLGEIVDYNKDYHNSFSGRPRLSSEAYPTSRLSLSYHIGYIVTIGDKSFWSYYSDEELASLTYYYTPESLDRRSGSTDWSDYKFVDWTPEREAWIVNLYEGFNKVIAQCRKFYRQDEKGIALIMDNGKKLLGN